MMQNLNKVYLLILFILFLYLFYYFIFIFPQNFNSTPVIVDISTLSNSSGSSSINKINTTNITPNNELKKGFIFFLKDYLIFGVKVLLLIHTVITYLLFNGVFFSGIGILSNKIQIVFELLQSLHSLISDYHLSGWPTRSHPNIINFLEGIRNKKTDLDLLKDCLDNKDRISQSDYNETRLELKGSLFGNRIMLSGVLTFGFLFNYFIVRKALPFLLNSLNLLSN